jgi:hypothetical protein
VSSVSDRDAQLERDVQLVGDFVRRLRRVALHPLATETVAGEEPPMPGSGLRKLMRGEVHVEVRSDGTATFTSQLPDEVLFESLAVRVRPFTLSGDRLYWRRALNALDRLAGRGDVELRLSAQWLRQEWDSATERSSRSRAYWSGYVMVGEDGDDEDARQFSDLELAYAWLYEDAAHCDEASTGYFDVRDRYRAAVGVFSHIAVVAIETLHYINALAEMGVIDLPPGTFTDRVVVTETEYVVEGRGYQAPVGADLGAVSVAGCLPSGFRPMFDAVQELQRQRSGLSVDQGSPTGQPASGQAQ